MGIHFDLERGFVDTKEEEEQMEQLTDDDGYLVNEEPRRYEVRDAETGEKLSGVSFILTPTGEEMHLLTDKGMQVGAMQDIGIYYHGELHDGHSGNNSRPVLTPIALEYMASKIFERLATGLDERHRKYGIGALERLTTEIDKLRAEYYRREEEHGTDENPTA